jgi:amidase
MVDELARLDATAQAELLCRGEVSALDLTEAAIARITRLNPQLNAVIHQRFEAARAEARAVTPGSAPFAGVPFLVKDFLCAMEGDPIHFGTRVLRDAKTCAPYDSYLARKLKAAGLVILGRTNTPELGTLPTTEPDAYGPTHNPWSLGHSTGGSSGGSAAAVAAGLVAAAHANDGGGSIRIPASECGLVGLKPSRGRTSFGPELGDCVGGLTCEGVVTRTVRDTAALLDAVAGRMPGDPYSAPPAARPYRLEVGAPTGHLRIGVRTTSPGGLGPVQDEVAAAVERVGQTLASLGHHVDVASPDALDDPDVARHFSTMYATNTAWMLDQLAAYSGRPVTADDVDPLNWALAELGRLCPAPQLIDTFNWIHGYTRRVASWWEGGFDLLLTPTLPEPPPLLGHFRPDPDDPTAAGFRATAFAAFTLPFNATGQPAISLPLHWTADGLPVGIQLVAAYCGEDVLIRVAAQLEEALPWAERRPPVQA